MPRYYKSTHKRRRDPRKAKPKGRQERYSLHCPNCGGWKNWTVRLDPVRGRWRHRGKRVRPGRDWVLDGEQLVCSHSMHINQIQHSGYVNRNWDAFYDEELAENRRERALATARRNRERQGKDHR